MIIKQRNKYTTGKKFNEISDLPILIVYLMLSTYLIRNKTQPELFFCFQDKTNMFLLFIH